jgi:hypothetical protein
VTAPALPMRAGAAGAGSLELAGNTRVKLPKSWRLRKSGHKAGVIPSAVHVEFVD